MSDRFLFQNARIKAMESRLLGPAQLARLAEASSAAEVRKILGEMGFGSSATGDNLGVDKLVEAEERAALVLLKEFNESGELTAFLLETDYLNLKALLKAAATGDRNPVLGEEGVVPVEELRTAAEGDVRFIRPYMAEAVRAVERLAAENKLTPHGIDCAVDKAMFRDIAETAKKGGKDIVEYFALKTDCVNIATFIRCKRWGLADKLFEENFVEGGTLDLAFFLAAYEGTEEAFTEKLRYTPFADIAEKAAEGNGLTALEKAVDEKLIGMWRSNKDDMFSAAPVVAFFLTKTAEARAVKLIYAGVKNNVDPRLIKERMREIYGA